MAPASLAERVFETVRPSTTASAPQANRAEPNAPADAHTALPARRALRRNASDDEILGLGSDAADSTIPAIENQLNFDFGAHAAAAGESSDPNAHADLDANGDPENLRAILDANPELRRDSQDAKAYREAFATPEDARSATALLADLNRMDSLFFSRRPEDHAELARSIASLDPAAFASLARAMAAQAATAPPSHGRHSEDRSDAESLFVSIGRPGANPKRDRSSLSTNRDEEATLPLVAQDDGAMGKSVAPNGETSPSTVGGRSSATPLRTQDSATPDAPTPTQTNFFHATNAAAVETVIDAIETQVERLLPDGVSKNARNRVVGEIYRELDSALRSNRQLTEQMRNAFRSGSLDAEHQRGIVSLIAGRARQALPGVAKRVLNEWTSTVVAANHDRRVRQRAAERRVDIAGSSGGGTESRRPTSPRDIDYARMSDGDILNL